MSVGFLTATLANPTPVRAQSNAELDALHAQATELFRAGKHGEALAVIERGLAAAERSFGPTHTTVGLWAMYVANLSLGQRRDREALARYEQATRIFESARGREHPSVGEALNGQAESLRAAGRYDEAEPLYRRSLAIREKALGPTHLDVASTLNNLGLLLTAQGRYADAEPLYRRSLQVREKALGKDHSEVGAVLNNLGELYRRQGRFAEAEPLFKRDLEIMEKARGPEHFVLAPGLGNLALVYLAQGREDEAERLFKRALAVREKAFGPNHPDVTFTLSGLAGLYRQQGRNSEAEGLVRRAVLILDTPAGANHPSLGALLNQLAELLREQSRFAEAEAIQKRSLAIRERALGPNHFDVGQSASNLGLIYLALGRYAEAEPLFKRSAEIVERAVGANHPDLGRPLGNLAAVYRELGRYAEAEQLAMRSLKIREHALGGDHPDVGGMHARLAVILAWQSKWDSALSQLEHATAISIQRMRRSAEIVGKELTASAKSEAEGAGFTFSLLVKVAYRQAEQTGARASEQSDKSFVAAQWAVGSQAAASLAQMAARQAKGDGELARLVRERQDLVGEWQTGDKEFIASVAGPADRRDMQGELRLRARLAAIDARLGEIDRRVAKDFPEYGALAGPEPLGIADVQAHLRANEALVLILDTTKVGAAPEESFIWVVTKTESRWVRSALGTPSLKREVAALRCGLDATAWDGDGAARCRGLLKADGGRILPFDLARAHELFQALFGQVEDLIKDKQLLIVPSGPLTALPFQVLVTAAPTAIPNPSPQGGDGYRSAAWFIKRHAITALPSVASLKSLRQFAKASKASQPFVGFGNPLLTGPSGTDKRAWARQICPQAVSTSVQVASRSALGPTSRYFRGNLADVDLVRRQYPLPETADELCAVARSAGSPETAVHLGEKASERTVKELSASGSLGNARIVHFATHGLLASESSFVGASKAEPALILTPPAEPTEEDDGLLTASEVAQLKLDADWVVLSACNTAAGGDTLNSEALSGLARAFFYAGARALLVSHWAVDSQATVSLVTKAFDELKRDGNLGRAEAMRRSMLVLIASGNDSAHPANWAPFVVVGEGAR